jgi:hypothetical protein
MTSPGSRHGLVAIVEEQWGLFTRAQAQETGMAWSTLARMARTGEVERVAHGVYRWSGVPHHELEPLRAAWLQLAPRVPAWQRVPSQGVVSHRSAASAFGIGELPADVHDFTVAGRRQTRRPDVRLHVGALATGDVVRVGGLLVTRPARIVADLLRTREDVEAVGRILSEALRSGLDDEASCSEHLEPLARAWQHRDGKALMESLLTESPSGMHRGVTSFRSGGSTNG